MPADPLDGELWIGRKQFQKTVGVVRRQDKTDHWKAVKYIVFDAPARPGPFEHRLDHLRTTLAAGTAACCELLAHDTCRDVGHLREELKRVEALGGEGLMLRQPGSLYAVGRSATLLKVKSFLDAEATVIGHEPGKGKHAGRLGAVVARLADGKTFSIGTGFTDAERADPPPIGTVVSFRYQELSEGGIPRFPSFLRVRSDLTPVVAAVVAAAVVPARPSPPTPIATPPAAPEGDPESGRPRRFEYTAGNAGKFWEVSLAGAAVTTRWGKIGTGGQEKAKSFPTEAKARHEYDKLIGEKTGKGYVETPAG